jgi:hypothetical protein
MRTEGGYKLQDYVVLPEHRGMHHQDGEQEIVVMKHLYCSNKGILKYLNPRGFEEWNRQSLGKVTNSTVLISQLSETLAFIDVCGQYGASNIRITDIEKGVGETCDAVIEVPTGKIFLEVKSLTIVPGFVGDDALRMASKGAIEKVGEKIALSQAITKKNVLDRVQRVIIDTETQLKSLKQDEYIYGIIYIYIYTIDQYFSVVLENQDELQRMLRDRKRRLIIRRLPY